MHAKARAEGALPPLRAQLATWPQRPEAMRARSVERAYMGPSGPALTLSLTHSSVAPPSLPPPFLSDPWADWKGPGVRTFILVSIGLYVYVQLLPSRESMKRPHTPSAARPSFDTVAKQGEDDPRPYMIRVFDYWIPGFEERQKAKMEEAYKEVDEARQANVFKTAVPSKIVRRADYLCVLESSLWRLSAHAKPADSDPLTLNLSVSSSFLCLGFLASPIIRRLLVRVRSLTSRTSRSGRRSTTSSSTC